MNKKIRCICTVMVFLTGSQVSFSSNYCIANAAENDSYWKGTWYKINSDGIVYEENVDDVTYITYEGSDYNNIKIPSEINNKPVTKIAERAFAGKKELEDIIIPESVEEIGQNAFSDCENLKNIKLPLKLTMIGSGCFCGCSSLKDISLPNSLKSIENSVFKECINLKTVKIPENVDKICYSAFLSCVNLNNIVIPSSTKSIESNAFSNCSTLDNIIFSEGLESIGERAFDGCKSLKKLTLPNSIMQIYQYAFNECENLQDINIPTSMNEIQFGIFSKCKNLSSIKILKNINNIYETVFNDANSNLTISGFQDSYVHSFAIKNNITFNDIGNNESNNIYNGICKDIILDDNRLIEYNKTGNDIRSTVIAENYNEVNNNEKYKEVLINSLISGDKEDTFYINEQIREIPTPLVEKIYDSPLKISIENAEDFNKYASFEELDSDTIAFYAPSKNTIYLSPNSYTKEGVLMHEIGHFYDSYIFGGNKKEYYSENNSEFLSVFNSSEKYNLFNKDQNHYTDDAKEYFAECFKYYFIYRNTLKEKAPKTYYFMNNLLETCNDDTSYKNHNWDNNSNFEESQDDLDNDTNCSNDDYNYIKNKEGITICLYKGTDIYVTIPDTIENIPVTKIKESAFERNDKIRSVVIPDSVTEISSFAFFECPNIQLVSMPKSLTKMGSCVFTNCINLEGVNVPEGVTTIECQTFEGCSKLRKAILPKSLTSIESYAFEKCTSLEEIIIPEGINTINYNTFEGCLKLKSIEIPKSVNNITQSAFLNCNNELIIKGCTGSYGYVFSKNNNFQFENISEDPIDVIYNGNVKIVVLDNKKLIEYNIDGYSISSTVLYDDFNIDNSIEIINNYKSLLFNSLIIDNYGGSKYNTDEINKEVQVLPKAFVEKIYDSTLKVYLESEDAFNKVAKYEGLDEDVIAFYLSKYNAMHFTKSSMEKEGVYLHEIGHFYDNYILGNNSGKAFSEEDSDFLSIYEGDEKNNLFDESQNHYTEDIKEYFAECFKYYYIYRDTLKQKAPKTYDYFEELMKDYKDDDSIINHNWDGNKEDNDDKNKVSTDTICDNEDKLEDYDTQKDKDHTNSGDKPLGKVIVSFMLGAIALVTIKKRD